MRSRRSRMSLRISACTVTSSAVVGSSATSTDGSHGQCLGDHRPLALATRQLVRVGVDAPFRVRDLDEVEQFDHPLACQLRGHRLVAAQHLGDLEADRVHGVERRHRLLEDHRHDAAAHRAQRARVEADDLQVAEADRPVHEGVLGQQAHHRQGDRRLPRARLADDRHRLPRDEVEAGAADRRVPVAVDPEVDLEVAHLDDGAARPACRVGTCSGLSITGASFRRARDGDDGGVEEVSSRSAGCWRSRSPSCLRRRDLGDRALRQLDRRRADGPVDGVVRAGWLGDVLAALRGRVRRRGARSSTSAARSTSRGRPSRASRRGGR